MMPQPNVRRSGNYHPSIWSHSLITELARSTYSDTRFLVRLEELKNEAKHLLDPSQNPLVLLQVIDSVQRLGVAYLLQKEIKCALEHYYENYYQSPGSCEEVALGFRLLRQHGYQVSSESMLSGFEDLTRGLKDPSTQGVRCLLAMYEASHLAVNGETDVEDAGVVVARHLKSLLPQMEGNLAKQVGHSLEMPFHWMMPRLEARRYIDVYGREDGRNPVLLELAKLDFNIVQSLHQNELMELSRWWKDLGLIEKLQFSRDRLVENYLWAVGVAFEPQFSDSRLWFTKVICILTTIDDIYDVYGSLDELELFTAAVESWEPQAIESLPEYMKPCLIALYNLVDQVTRRLLEIHGWDTKPLICKEWKRLCKGYLVEAKWFNIGFKPTLKEYLENAWITVGGPLGMVHAYFLQESKIPSMAADCLQLDHGFKLIYLSALVARLNDDLGTSKAEMERGDVLKSIECFMNETGEFEENARDYVKHLIRDIWNEVNEECHRTQLPENFVNMVMNMARTAQCIFQYGDGIGTSTGVTRDRIVSLFVENIQ